jgi:erythromycin esterase-like protein
MTASIEELAQVVNSTTILSLLPTKPRLLALGEPTHGENALLDLRNHLFHNLVEHHGYRTIAVESDCLMGQIVNDYVASGTDSLDDVMERGFSHEWGAFAGNRELVRWMRAYNDGRPADEQVRFAGFDGPLEITHAVSPREAITALHTYLTADTSTDLLPCSRETLDHLLGADDRWTNRAAMMDPSQSIGRTPEAKELRVIADDLVALLEAQEPQLRANSTEDEWDQARLYARTATGLLRYHHWMADTSPSRMAWLLAVRDSMMAANLLALAERGPTLVNAHNSHLQRDKSTIRMGGVPAQWWSAGAIVSTRLGKDYAFLATALGTIPHQGVDAPPTDTLEGILYAGPQDQYVVEPRRLATGLGDVTPRVSPWYGYAPLDPTHLSSIDGLVFVKDAAVRRTQRTG